MNGVFRGFLQPFLTNARIPQAGYDGFFPNPFIVYHSSSVILKEIRNKPKRELVRPSMTSALAEPIGLSVGCYEAQICQ